MKCGDCNFCESDGPDYLHCKLIKDITMRDTKECQAHKTLCIFRDEIRRLNGKFKEYCEHLEHLENNYLDLQWAVRDALGGVEVDGKNFIEEIKRLKKQENEKLEKDRQYKE